ncbi:NADPH oxidase 5 [Lingula anatina]|uniref:NADPH oxidase 5 n=1 Tax=Lingula anatina TaxID=7574 RepID=A0A1S3J9C6_LINAN|nr:NADPH oxidase 5 [Lingula anatina]|eukprot:XP_013406474.1 NADPH oxidase 5 [Lingula anatina]
MASARSKGRIDTGHLPAGTYHPGLEQRNRNNGMRVVLATPEPRRRFDIQTHLPSVFSVCVYVLLVASLLTEKWFAFAADHVDEEFTGWEVLARMSARLINFHALLVLLMMLRVTMTLISSRIRIPFWIPLDKHIKYHKVAGMVLLVCSLLHTVGHIGNAAWAVTEHNHTLVEYLFTVHPHHHQASWMGGTAYISGWALLAILLALSLSGMPWVRAKNFQAFYFTHLLYLPFMIVMFIHAPSCWKWIIVPSSLLVIEKVYRTKAVKRLEYGKIFIQEGVLLPSKVTHLVIKRPDNFNFTAGDYIFLNIPKIATFEWHPFTISSAPEDPDHLWLHIRAVGRWTNKLYEYFEEKREIAKRMNLPHIRNIYGDVDGIEEDASSLSSLESSSDGHGIDNVAFEAIDESRETKNNAKNEEKSRRSITHGVIPIIKFDLPDKGNGSGSDNISESESETENDIGFEDDTNIEVVTLKSDTGMGNGSYTSSNYSLQTYSDEDDESFNIKQSRRLTSFRNFSDRLGIPENFRQNLSGGVQKKVQRSKSIDNAHIMKTELDPFVQIPPGFDRNRRKSACALKLPETEVVKHLQRRLSTWQGMSHGQNFGHLSQMPFIYKMNADEHKPSIDEALEVYIDGAYGAPASNFFQAEHAVMIALGIGVTPFASILQSIMRRYNTAKHECPKCTHSWIDEDLSDTLGSLKKVDFFWISRGIRSFEWFSDLLTQLELEQLELVPGASMDTFLDLHIYNTETENNFGIRDALLAPGLELVKQNNLTDVIPGLLTQAQRGRPNWNAVFKEINNNRRGRVTVYFCGPRSVASIVKGKCIEYGFRFTKENFG